MYGNAFARMVNNVILISQWLNVQARDALFLQKHMIQSFRVTQPMHVLTGFEPCLLSTESTTRLGYSHDRVF